MRDENAQRSKVFMINLFLELDFSPLELLIIDFLFVFSPLFISLWTHLCEKLSWSKTLFKKWFNIKNKAQDFHPDQDVFSIGFSLPLPLSQGFSHLRSGRVHPGHLFPEATMFLDYGFPKDSHFY